MALDGVQRIPDVLQHWRKRLPVVFSEGDTERRFSELPLKARLPQRQGLECPRDDMPVTPRQRAGQHPAFLGPFRPRGAAHRQPTKLDSSATATTACPSISATFSRRKAA